MAAARIAAVLVLAGAAAAAPRALGAVAALAPQATQATQATQDPTPANERVDLWPNGAVKQRCTVDEAGRQHGTCEQFAEDGTRTLVASFWHGLRDGQWREWRANGTKMRFLAYKRDVLHGRCEEFHADGSPASSGEYRDGRRTGRWVDVDASGKRRRTAEYKDGVLHGSVRIELDGRTLTKQTWRDGELMQLDGMQPFPVPRATLDQELRAILDAAPPALDPEDLLAPARWQALRRLQAYRRLCGVPFEEMALVPEWNLRCDAAAEACRRNGGLSHHPTKPQGMDDARFQLAVEGARHSNLAMDSSLPDSVDGYMNDSDPSNIARIGHRRWCLNPPMRKTGFGSDGRFHAMWSFDESGKGAKGMEAVYYPPPGWVPIDLFTAERAFSIMLLRGGAPKADELKVQIRALDADYLPEGEPLPLDHVGVAPPGPTAFPCLIFRAPSIVAMPGRRYLVEVSTDGGKTSAHRYLIEFCAPVRVEVR